jgi:hypothetical protein
MSVSLKISAVVDLQLAIDFFPLCMVPKYDGSINKSRNFHIFMLTL